MSEPLRFMVVETEEQFNALKVFAASFGHVINNGTRLPIVNAYRGDRQIGYYQIMKAPIVAPAFHSDPKICSHRDTIEFISHVKTHSFLNSLGGRTPNGECIAILPEIPAPGFTNEILAKLGFEDLHQKLWLAKG